MDLIHQDTLKRLINRVGEYDWIREASGYFLTEHFPEHWADLSTLALVQYVSERLSEDYENLDSATVVSQIEEMASTLEARFKNQLEEFNKVIKPKVIMLDQKKVDNHQWVVAASNHYLTNPLPSQWVALPVEELHKFLEENTQEAFEKCPPARVLNLITKLGDKLHRNFLENVKEFKYD